MIIIIKKYSIIIIIIKELVMEYVASRVFVGETLDCSIVKAGESCLQDFIGEVDWA